MLSKGNPAVPRYFGTNWVEHLKIAVNFASINGSAHNTRVASTHVIATLWGTRPELL